MHCNAAYLRLIFTQRQYQTEKISKHSYWAHFMPYEHWYIYMVVNSHNIYPETIPEIILICYPCLSNRKRGTRVRAEYTFHVSPTTGGKWIWHLFAKSFACFLKHVRTLHFASICICKYVAFYYRYLYLYTYICICPASVFVFIHGNGWLSSVAFAIMQAAIPNKGDF